MCLGGDAATTRGNAAATAAAAVAGAGGVLLVGACWHLLQSHRSGSEQQEEERVAARCPSAPYAAKPTRAPRASKPEATALACESTLPRFSEVFDLEALGLPSALVLSCLPPEEAVRLRGTHRRLASRLRPEALLRGFGGLGLQKGARKALPLSEALHEPGGHSGSRAQIVAAVFSEALALGAEDFAEVLRRPDAKGWPPVLLATQRRQSSSVATLLQMHAHPDCREPVSGWSPLMYAVTASDRDTAEVLLAHGANVNLVAKPHDWTALYAALVSNREDMVGLLLDAGADASIVKTRHGHLSYSVVEALQQHLERRAAQRATGAKVGAAYRAGLSPPRVEEDALTSRPAWRPHDYFQYT